MQATRNIPKKMKSRNCFVHSTYHQTGDSQDTSLWDLVPHQRSENQDIRHEGEDDTQKNAEKQFTTFLRTESSNNPWLMSTVTTAPIESFSTTSLLFG